MAWAPIGLVRPGLLSCDLVVLAGTGGSDAGMACQPQDGEDEGLQGGHDARAAGGTDLLKRCSLGRSRRGRSASMCGPIWPLA